VRGKKKIRRESDEEIVVVDGDRGRRLFNLSYVVSVLYTLVFFSNPTFDHQS